jgi:ABC-type branched-subunit amino acid transport system ATPase component
LATILGLTESSGEILLRSERIDHSPTWQRVRRGIRALPSGSCLFPSLQVRDVMRLARNHAARDNEADFACRALSALSGGERQSVAWRALLSGTGPREALILDEPFGGLDGTRVKLLASELLAARSSTVLILVPRSVEV